MDDYMNNMKKGAVIAVAMLTLNGCGSDISDTLKTNIDESRNAAVEYLESIAQKDQYHLVTQDRVSKGEKIEEIVYQGNKQVMIIKMGFKERIKPGDNHWIELKKLGLKRDYKTNKISAELAKKYPLRAEPETNLHNPSGYLPIEIIPSRPIDAGYK
jgi:hypothetical protein